jgi:hypothetical protein
VMYVLMKGLTIKRKVEVLDEQDSKMRTAVVRYHYGTNDTKICFIRKNEERIPGHYSCSSPQSSA